MSVSPDQPADATRPGGFSAPKAVLGWVQEIAPYGVFTTDAELRIQSWNQWLAARSGRKEDELLGQSLFAAFPEIEARQFHDRYRRALRGEISVLSAALHRYLIPIPLGPPDKGAAHMLQTVRIAPLPDGDRIVGTITSIEDVTERELHAAALQRQQQFDHLLSRALSTLLRTVDPLQDMAALLPALAPSLGLDAFLAHVLDGDSDTLRLVASGGIPSRVRDSLVSIPRDRCDCVRGTTGNTPFVTDLGSNPDPSYAELRQSGLRLFACFPIAIGEQILGTLTLASYRRDSLPEDERKFLVTLVQYLAIAMERTGRESQLHAAQATLQEHSESLEMKIRERTARLLDTIAQLESFSYTVAHDLRAPIRGIKAFSQVLEEDYAHLLPADGIDVLARLQRASDRLDALTRDLLHFSKLGRSEVNLAPVDVASMVNELAAQQPALEAAIRIEPPLGVVWAQDTFLQQSFANVFENALKFVRPGVAPRVVVRAELIDRAPTPTPVEAPAHLSGQGAADLHGSRWRIWIEDNGVGIPPHARERIFGIFERLVGTESIEGTGIGLAIVARSMHLMGGACGVESEVGAGSRFWLELAAAPTPPPPRAVG